VPETPAFQLVVKRAFATRRKTLRNAWRGVHADIEAVAAREGVSLDARGETLDVEAFARVAAALSRPA
jgi:16S rRNA (adenine1518-N6/adenine1519-N6)-dimethyltransferase